MAPADNYVTLFPRETRTVIAMFRTSTLAGHGLALHLEGYNVDKVTLPLKARMMISAN